MIYLGCLNDVRQEREHLTLMLKVYSPRNEGLMIRRCPCIRCDMYTPRVFLEKFVDLVMAFLEASVDIPAHSDVRRKFDVRAPCCEQLLKLTVINNICRPVVFSDPLDKSSPR